ncbi:four helix bundle protein [Flavobacterium fryxellicola]|uniref:four helix bundle protein n=1 Tax=Flavobacterium fryxellicola TaxID=249352 RepID=UPI000915136E|nr:four helix bundle protein [Flavobacterium fryxellicola]SHN75992.1 four helix bundle protein [Flavobacterium fryxellicola]
MSFAQRKKFGVTNQSSGASVSIPSNSAEGLSRQSNKDFAQFLEIAIGSAYEVETQILISSDLGFITSQDLKQFANMLDEIVKMTLRFKATLLDSFLNFQTARLV